jgi:hypothetical protein
MLATDRGTGLCACGLGDWSDGTEGSRAAEEGGGEAPAVSGWRVLYEMRGTDMRVATHCFGLMGFGGSGSCWVRLLRSEGQSLVAGGARRAVSVLASGVGACGFGPPERALMPPRLSSLDLT